MNAAILSYLLKLVKVMALLPCVLELGWRVLGAIVRLVRRGNKSTKEKYSMNSLTRSEKLEIVAKLKETQEWVNLTAHVEEIVIKHVTDKCGDVWYVEAAQIATEIVASCSQEVMDAFTGSTSIPAEWKLASPGDIVQFVLENLVLEGRIIAGIWIKPETPAA